MSIKTTLLGLLFFFIHCLGKAQDSFSPVKATSFTYGGYVKLDAIYTDYRNGLPPRTSAMNDFVVPGGIPVGDDGSSSTYGFHVKESRFDFGVTTRLKKNLSVVI